MLGSETYLQAHTLHPGELTDVVSLTSADAGRRKSECSQLGPPTQLAPAV